MLDKKGGYWVTGGVWLLVMVLLSAFTWITILATADLVGLIDYLRSIIKVTVEVSN